MNINNLEINELEYLNFLKNKFTLIHLSNIFFRDMHYGTIDFLLNNGKKVSYLDAESIAKNIAEALVNKGILLKVNDKTFTLIYPEFALPKKETNQIKK